VSYRDLIGVDEFSAKAAERLEIGKLGKSGLDCHVSPPALKTSKSRFSWPL
jgi:hypothetical protein